MTERLSSFTAGRRWLPLLLAIALLFQVPVWAQTRSGPRGGDYIVAIVNQELVTAGEVEQRLARVRDNARRNNAQLPPDAELRKQVIDSLVEERVLVTYARDSGMRIDDAELDRAVQSVAAQNQLTMPQLRDRLKQEGMDYARFRSNLRDQMLVERVREREVQSRIKVNDKDIDELIDKQRAAMQQAEVEYDIAQILVTVPEGASEAVVAERQARARSAQQRVRDGEDFAAVAKEVSEDGNRQRGGEIGLKPASRLPDVFVEGVKNLQPGQVAPTLLRSGAGFHLLKLLDRKEPSGLKVTQTHARHILLRTSPELPTDVAVRRLRELKQQLASGARFDELARQHSEDGSAAQGGDLGWTGPGSFVPEFEEAMNKLPVGGISDPVVSRFGVHLIQVIDRREVPVDMKQLREQARNVLREQKFDEVYADWIRDLRSKAYIEMREPPQ